MNEKMQDPREIKVFIEDELGTWKAVLTWAYTDLVTIDLREADESEIVSEIAIL